MRNPPHSIDAVIFGGGIAGLWILDELIRRNFNAILLESKALGHGQTIASQGIIHGGLKYMFDAHLTSPAKAIAEMPVVWRECLAGKRQPDLSNTTIRSEQCHIWGTASLKSRLFLKGSAIALRAAPTPLEKPDWPIALANVTGTVMAVPEQVIDPASVLRALADRNKDRIFLIDGEQRTELVPFGSRQFDVRLFPQGRHREAMVLRPNRIVFAAGEGNAALREQARLSPQAMQRRPLHMVMARGNLPELFGHCVGGPKPRITVTTATDSNGRRIWQIGGQIAEDGVNKSPAELVQFARKELTACIPGLDSSGVELGTYAINRAEATTASGQRPDDVHLISESNVLTVWPTKLALAPRLAERVAKEVASCQVSVASKMPRIDFSIFRDLVSPPIALPPWEMEAEWFAAC